MNSNREELLFQPVLSKPAARRAALGRWISYQRPVPAAGGELVSPIKMQIASSHQLHNV